MKALLMVTALSLPLLLVACDQSNSPPIEPVAEMPAEVPTEPAVTPDETTTEMVAETPAELQAHAVLAATEGNQAAGTLTLTANREGVRITGELTGVAPGGEHGFHVHELGDCSAADASSAGPHFNPEDHQHGHPGQGEHHAGDMLNLRADDNGVLNVDVFASGLSLGDGGSWDVLGRSLVLHADADDYVSQPAGDSGPRIACGVIER